MTTRKIELMQAVGLLPDDLGQLPLIEDAREFVHIVFAIFDQFGVPDEAAVAVLDALEGREPGSPETVRG